MQCKERKVQSLKTLWTQSPNLCMTGTHNKDFEKCLSVQKILLTAAELGKHSKGRIETHQNGNAGIHTSSRRCRYHLNSLQSLAVDAEAWAH